MLSDDDFIHTNSGFVAASTSIVVALAGADTTTAGNSVVVFWAQGAAATTAVPAGFVAMGTTGSSAFINCYVKSNVSDGESSWTFTVASATDHAWIVLEVSNLETVDPIDAGTNSAQTSLSNGGTLSTGTGDSVGLSTVQFAVFNAAVLSGTASKSWGSFTNGFTEVEQIESTSGSNRHTLAATRTFNDGDTAGFESTGTLTISTGSAIACRARMYIFREKDSPVAAPLKFHTGWEFGTHGGMVDPAIFSNIYTLLGTLDEPVGTWGTHYLVQAGSARNGGYGLSYSVSGAICNIATLGFGTASSVLGRNFRVVSGSGVAVVATLDSTATDLELVYDFSTNKYGLRWGSGGTPGWQDGTTDLNTWVWIDFRGRVGDTTHAAVWRLETGTDTYTAQPAPADLTGQSVSTFSKVLIGGLSSQTLTMDVDEVVGTSIHAAYPLGVHKVVLCKVDPAGTPTVSGTSSNFSVMTANGTLAAWNATNARNALDEVPPTVSASADGVVQTATAASDYMEFPMETYTLASDEVIAGVRLVVALWGGTGAGTGTLGIRGWDGTTEAALVPNTFVYDAGSPTAISSTEPWWNAAQWQVSGGWTQDKLNNAAARIGYSSDAAPDMGVSAVYLEVAIRKTAAPFVAHRLTSDEDPEAVAATVTERLHPDNSGVRTYTVSNNDATRTAEFRFYETGGAEHADSPVVVAPLDPPVDVTISAETFGEIESTTFGWQ